MRTNTKKYGGVDKMVSARCSPGRTVVEKLMMAIIKGEFKAEEKMA